MSYDDYYAANVIDETIALECPVKQTKPEEHGLCKGFKKFRFYYGGKWSDGKFHKHVCIESYSSGDVGTRVYNAITGNSYPFTVGSKQESKLFKVTDAYGNRDVRTPRMLYYNNPEEYEKHFNVVLSSKIKDAWLKRSETN